MQGPDIQLTPAQLEEILQGVSLKELEAIEHQLLVQTAQDNDTPEGFFAFYKLIFGNDCPPHQRTIVEHIYNAKSQDKGSLTFAWRGSWKTTTISIGFVAYRIGKDPHRANLIIQANDDSANKVTQAITDIISRHPSWREVFPDIVPNEEEGWGVDGGYYVKDASMTDGEWARKTAARKDPSLLGLGIRSRSLIGKHPDGVLLLDDIHDEENTKSDRENQNVINKVTGTILPFIVEDYSLAEGERMLTWNIAVGTPWRDDDAYHFLKESGESLFIEVPALRECEVDSLNAVLIDDKATGMFGYYNLTWPEQVTPELILTWRRRAGKREFARMYMLDLAQSKLTGIKYQTYPAELINAATWSTSAGVDFASIRTRDADTKNRDYFAIAYMAKIPTGGAVIFGGRFGHYTELQGEQIIEQIQQTLPNFGYTYVEDDGKGEVFVSTLLRKPHLRVIPMLTKGRGKALRQEREMAPWLEVGIIRISDADDEFLNLLRRSLDDYPDGNDDVRDAAYWACKSVPEVLIIPDGDNTLPAAVRNEKEKKRNPFNSLGG
jgi:hypothetical protein